MSTSDEDLPELYDPAIYDGAWLSCAACAKAAAGG